MYTPTTISNASHQAQNLSQELDALIREHRTRNPTLGLPDTLMAVDLLKASLLSESGVAAARSRVLVVVTALFLVGAAAFILLSSQ